jgi:rare lipoprotein A
MRLPPDATPRPEARSRYGNGPVYEVFGERYEVLDSSNGYQAQGVASWYGKKFHGRLTASREPYDMYAMTAAHKSLPIPSYVEVRNLSNNRRIVVRVNDRGPFVDNRIIDLSYSAALRLDMVRNGTGLVEVTAINVDTPATSQRGDTPAARGKPAPARSPAGKTTDARIYVQVGAFGDRDNAARRYRLLRDSGIDQSFVYEETTGPAALYRVRIGPIKGVAQYDKVVADLHRIGIGDTHLVSE